MRTPLTAPFTRIGQRAVLLVGAMALSLVDAAFSLALSGRFSEVNPLLRPLLSSPVLFLVVKTALVLAGLFSLARLDESRIAGVLLGAGAGLYLFVDGYWVWRVLVLT